jgi:hypothetical protein
VVELPNPVNVVVGAEELPEDHDPVCCVGGMTITELPLVVVVVPVLLEELEPELEQDLLARQEN